MMHVEYVYTDELPGDLRRALFEWDADPFQAKSWGLTWRPKEHHILLYEGDRPVSHVGLVREIVGVGEQRIPIGGIGDVITVPEFQGRGLAQKGIAEAVRVTMQDWGLKHGLLFCFPQLRTFYESLGWAARREPVWVSQPNGRMALPNLSMVKSWEGGEWPSGEIEIEGFPW